MSRAKAFAQKIGWGKPTLKTATLRRLSLVMPILSVLVSFAIVRHEYLRRDRLRGELAHTQREFDRLGRLAEQRTGHVVVTHHDDHHDGHHDD